MAQWGKGGRMPVQRPDGAPPLLPGVKGAADCAGGRCVHQQPGHDLRSRHAAHGCHYKLVSLTQMSRACIFEGGDSLVHYINPTTVQNPGLNCHIPQVIYQQMPIVLSDIQARPRYHLLSHGT